MADYSEFPTTPTRWQENLWPEPITTPEAEPPAATGKRAVDRFSLVVGLAFAVLGLLVAVDVDLPDGLLWDGGMAWLLLLGAGVALLVTELRRARRHR
ncbi:hypothetical protein [Modestobacter lapidis]|nr:hypothetical protein [Modestobacter lapidis]